MKMYQHPVHPRLRGELLSRLNSFDPGVRLIPAYAGNSVAPEALSVSLTVHPRLRGELDDLGIYNYSITGSSPLTRGTPHEV